MFVGRGAVAGWGRRLALVALGGRLRRGMERPEFGVPGEWVGRAAVAALLPQLPSPRVPSWRDLLGGGGDDPADDAVELLELLRG